MQSNFMSQAPNSKKLKGIGGEETKKSYKDVRLDSPTSTDMQRSLLIAGADPSFEFMASLKRKRNN